MIVLFNCTDIITGWIPDLPETIDTCDAIRKELDDDGMVDACLAINGCIVTPINVLWAQFGLGLPIPDAKKSDIREFTRRQLRKDGDDSALRAEMLRRSGFLPVRDFLSNLPLELLKYAAAHPEREIDRIVNRFAEELKKRWTAA